MANTTSWTQRHSISCRWFMRHQEIVCYASSYYTLCSQPACVCSRRSVPERPTLRRVSSCHVAEIGSHGSAVGCAMLFQNKNSAQIKQTSHSNTIMKDANLHTDFAGWPHPEKPSACAWTRYSHCPLHMICGQHRYTLSRHSCTHMCILQ